MGNILKNIRKSAFKVLNFFCSCCPDNSLNNSQIWTYSEMLLNKIKHFETILTSHGLAFCLGSSEYLKFILNYPNSVELIEKLIQLESVICYILLQKLNYIFIPNILKKMHTTISEKHVHSIFQKWAFEQLWYSKCLKKIQFRSDTHTHLATRNILLSVGGCGSY